MSRTILKSEGNTLPRIHNIRTGRRKMTAEERWQSFLDKIGPPDADGHRPWDGARDRQGYGHFWDGARLQLAHRYLYEHEHGPLPPWPKRVVRHTCDITWCMTLEHLVDGTQRDNWQDSRDRGRDRWAGYTAPPKPPRPPRQPRQKLRQPRTIHRDPFGNVWRYTHNHWVKMTEPPP